MNSSRKETLVNKKNIILSAAGALLVALAVGYFVVVPSVQTGSYKETVTKKHSELNEAINKLSAVLERDTFLKSEVEPSTIHSDVKIGNEAVKNAEAKLALVKNDLTSFSALPLLDMNEKYKTAIALKADEQQYIAKTEAFVAEMKAILAYMGKNADMIAEATEFGEAIGAASEAESAGEYASKIEAAIKAFQPTLDELGKLTPPASMKESHEYLIKSFREWLALYKDSAAAVRAENLEKADEIDVKILDKSEEITKKTDDYNAKFIRESELRKLDDALNQLDREIDRKQTSL